MPILEIYIVYPYILFYSVLRNILEFNSLFLQQHIKV